MINSADLRRHISKENIHFITQFLPDELLTTRLIKKLDWHHILVVLDCFVFL
jgi:hypothetical protein